ncbi:iron chaperone [Vagococcus vulneris]|uniref:YdhG-like domain-containing protein n=1 Tax=Vagococcus vulneris TaxID=1977869 RepID=A0A430A0I8_9ENTE|nr:iron chaperone [Vagococcus vulneris]RST99843.1 hypothetical protein CBF37_03725 [Vagococcus vulneris]
MENFNDYLQTIELPEQRERMEHILNWIQHNFPELDTRIAWKQPMFTSHDTFILGLSISKKHIAVAPEQIVISTFADEINAQGYSHTKQLLQIPWDKDIPYDLIKQFINFNLTDKKDHPKFWR